MEGTAKEIWKVAHNLYEIQQITPKMIMTFLWTEPMKIIKPVL